MDTMHVATFDAGTTAVKGVLVDGSGRIVVQASSAPIPLHAEGDEREQDPEDWWRRFTGVSRELLRLAIRADPAFDAHSIGAVIMSGQMQDVITLDGSGRPLRPAILYSDGRAAPQAEELRDAVGTEAFRDVVGSPCEGSLPVTKLMWLRVHEPDVFSRIRHVLIDAKDFLVLRMTGEYVGDVTACSTSGAMDIRARRWDARILDAAGVNAGILPSLRRPQDLVGTVLPRAARQTGLPAGAAVYAGIGDAGATTLAAGVTRPGQYNVNLGTSGWVATVSEAPVVDRPGIANLACETPSGFINGVPFLNAGDVHRWAARVLAGGDYDRFAGLLDSSEPGAHGVLCLPYLVGERFPVMNPSIRAAFTGIGVDATAADLARAALEGVVYSIRQGLESFVVRPDEVTLIGGGARESRWCRIMADVLGVRVEAFRDAEVMPSVALAGLVLEADSRAVARLLRERRESTVYEPDMAAHASYDAAYRRFLRLYPAVDALTGHPTDPLADAPSDSRR
ncbi:FGGY family carbohydrate kinase [uncultured Bifidobacterium sp.]|uniref:xylulokinase n=1 Tax=uncultured Bifidobacterium sp. TaxID=165187 RepID=UPI0028DB0BFE|nr:FGGY family carbohydrate kinase [uncultured Bifidobacterium sp.]